MSRLIGSFAVCAVLAIPLGLPMSASAIVSDPAYGCPPAFELVVTFANGAVDVSDHNGDGWGCRKSVANGRYVFIDNTIFGGALAQGVTDTGAAVLVDTATGDVIGSGG